MKMLVIIYSIIFLFIGCSTKNDISKNKVKIKIAIKNNHDGSVAEYNNLQQINSMIVVRKKFKRVIHLAELLQIRYLEKY